MNSTKESFNQVWSDVANGKMGRRELTPFVLALAALLDYGCDCGTGEEGTCLTCLCETALRDLWEENQRYRYRERAEVMNKKAEPGVERGGLV